jgi:hypothetical protein
VFSGVMPTLEIIKKTASKLTKNTRYAAKKQCFSVRNTRKNPSSNFGSIFCAFLSQQVFVLIYVVYVFGVGRAMEVRVGYLAKVSRGAEHIFVLATHSARIFLEPDLLIGKLPENLHNLQFQEMDSRCFVLWNNHCCLFQLNRVFEQCFELQRLKHCFKMPYLTTNTTTAD